MIEQLILVDAEDNKIGVAEKLHAHREGLRHRAFSVFIFRKQDDCLELLMQKRHPNKYHCGGLWTNTCCGHPRPQESMVQAAGRRLYEEMGLMGIPLHLIACFHYKVPVDHGLTENEIDHIFVGFYEGQAIQPNPDEVSEFRWVDVGTLPALLAEHSEWYTPWFSSALNIALVAVKE
jgi:isopentenyl-diphosphate delta-isomerase type 1